MLFNIPKMPFETSLFRQSAFSLLLYIVSRLMNGNSKTVQCLSNGPSIWVDCQHPEGEHLCLVLRPVLMKTAWQSASLDNNIIKH